MSSRGQITPNQDHRHKQSVDARVNPRGLGVVGVVVEGEVLVQGGCVVGVSRPGICRSWFRCLGSVKRLGSREMVGHQYVFTCYS